MKTWQKIKKLRKMLRAIDETQFKAFDKDELKEYLELEKAERLYTYRFDFYEFVIQVMKAEDKGEPPCKLGKVHKKLCRALRSAKNLNKHLLVLVPRYHLKTQIATIYYRIWRIVNDANLCSLIVSGTLELSKSTSRSIRHELEHNTFLRELYQGVLPDWIFNDRRNKWSETQINVHREKNYAQCSLESVGVDATVTGKHFGEITMDDIVTPQNSTTPEQCQKVIQAFKYFCSIVNPQIGRFIVVGTPYTDSDLYTFLRDPEILKTFMIFIWPVYDSNHQPIWPEMFSHATLEQIRITQGTYTFSTQYLLDPVPEEEMEFKKSWIQIYRDLPKDVNGNDIRLTKYILVDPITFKPTTSTSKDRGVILVVGVDHASNWYVLDYKLYNRAKEVDLFHGIFDMSDKWGTITVGWETVAYQLQGKYNLEEEATRSGRRLKIVALKPGHTKKEVRIRALLPYFERGQIFIKPWMTELLNELFRFPYGVTRDIIDALAYMIQMIPSRRKGTWRPDQAPYGGVGESQKYF